MWERGPAGLVFVARRRPVSSRAFPRRVPTRVAAAAQGARSARRETSAVGLPRGAARAGRFAEAATRCAHSRDIRADDASTPLAAVPAGAVPRARPAAARPPAATGHSAELDGGYVDLLWTAYDPRRAARPSTGFWGRRRGAGPRRDFRGGLVGFGSASGRLARGVPGGDGPSPDGAIGPLQARGLEALIRPAAKPEPAFVAGGARVRPRLGRRGGPVRMFALERPPGPPDADVLGCAAGGRLARLTPGASLAAPRRSCTGAAPGARTGRPRRARGLREPAARRGSRPRRRAPRRVASSGFDPRAQVPRGAKQPRKNARPQQHQAEPR